MKIGKKTMKQGGTTDAAGGTEPAANFAQGYNSFAFPTNNTPRAITFFGEDSMFGLGNDADILIPSIPFFVAKPGNNGEDNFTVSLNKGGSKHKSRKSRKTKKSKKTKKGCGAHEGGKKKCLKHCHRKPRRTRKGLKHRKN